MKPMVLNNIKKIRKELKLTTRELAEKSDLVHSSITEIENGDHMPSHLVMLLLCRGLQKPFHEVFETNPNVLDSYFGRNTDHS